MSISTGVFTIKPWKGEGGQEKGKPYSFIHLGMVN
jgi:hypothetical protein